MKWEIFCDTSYYDLWCMRPVGDKDFNSPLSFHFAKKEDAEALLEIVNKSI